MKMQNFHFFLGNLGSVSEDVFWDVSETGLFRGLSVSGQDRCLGIRVA